MARIKSNTVDYFPHFVDSGKTMFILKSKYGNDGYAFWFQLLELLCATDGHFYDCRDEYNWQYLLATVGLDDVSVTEMLALLANLGQIDPFLYQNERIIWCQKLVDNLEQVYKKRGREVPEKPGDDVSVTEIPQSKVKERRVKEKKKLPLPKNHNGKRKTERDLSNPHRRKSQSTQSQKGI